MTRDDIIRMAREAGLAFDSEEYPDIWQTYMYVGREEIERFAALVAAEKDKEIERLRGAITELLESARAPGGGNRGHILRPATREHEARVEKAWLDLEAALRREGTI